MRFTPARIVVKQGDTIRFVVKNRGTLAHEAVIGTTADLQQHADLMRKFPAMEHDEPYIVHVAPGGQGEIIWQFTSAGEFRFACLIPGHFEAGMVGSIAVEARTVKAQAQPQADPAGRSASHSDDLASGEVRRVDKVQNKITLRHGEIRSVEMPPMTMVFQVRAATLLDAVKVGDKVLFRAIKEPDGTLVVTELRLAP
jgi:Cu/Ag efflux protein CusF